MWDLLLISERTADCKAHKSVNLASNEEVVFNNQLWEDMRNTWTLLGGKARSDPNLF